MIALFGGALKEVTSGAKNRYNRLAPIQANAMF